MSPASQGSLEVERYIGSNLISSCTRVNNPRNNGKGRRSEDKVQRSNQNSGDAFSRHGNIRQGYTMPNVITSCGCRGTVNRVGQFAAAGWTGVPLISVVDSKKKNQYQDRSRIATAEDDSSLRTPLSRLAIHTQGAPIILSGRCYNGRKNQNRGNQNRSGDVVIRRSNKYKDNISHGHSVRSDCLSVASDESSGSGQSENCLPRIIKPRKRRKKDKKPLTSTNEEPAEKNSEGLKSTFDNKSEIEISTRSLSDCSVKPNLTVGLKVCIGSQNNELAEDDSHYPKLLHNFEDVTESEALSYGCLPSSCQCHYCDPSGIWDAPSNFFSKNSEKDSTFLSPTPLGSRKSFQYLFPPDLVLRRSWSEPTPDSHNDFRGSLWRSNSFNDWKIGQNWTEKVVNNNQNSIINRNFSADKNSNRNDKSSVDKANYSKQCLEVSTEIVTSPNGHRDLEIRFYSSSPSS